MEIRDARPWTTVKTRNQQRNRVCYVSQRYNHRQNSPLLCNTCHALRESNSSPKKSLFYRFFFAPPSEACSFAKIVDSRKKKKKKKSDGSDPAVTGLCLGESISAGEKMEAKPQAWKQRRRQQQQCQRQQQLRRHQWHRHQQLTRKRKYVERLNVRRTSLGEWWTGGRCDALFGEKERERKKRTPWESREMKHKYRRSREWNRASARFRWPREHPRNPRLNGGPNVIEERRRLFPKQNNKGRERKRERGEKWK